MIELLDARTRTIASQSRATPPYAILSHRWGRASDEVTYQEINMNNHIGIRNKPGYAKIVAACDFALGLGFHHVWVDTCCIDKTSYDVQSSALSDMFHWYRGAQVCCAYLDDVAEDMDPVIQMQQFRQSKWFTRGWTLQELIAPPQVIFFNQNWVEIGTKSSLIETITAITNIPKTVLLMNHPGEMSIAQCISWAAGRQTRRVEDRAYSLMGLLGVSIPMFYGEGEKAFERLQLEIIKTSDDQSIFAWTGDADRGAGGLLARSPDDFAGSRDIQRVIDNDDESAPYEMTNKGLRMRLHLEDHANDNNLKWATLNCRRGATGPLLRILLEGQGSRTTFKRVQYNELQPNNNTTDPVTEIYIKDSINRTFEITNWMRREPDYLFVVRQMVSLNAQVHNNCATVTWSNIGQDLLLRFQHSGHAGVLAFANPGGNKRLEICVGLHNWNAWCAILEDPTTHFEEFWTGEGIRDERWLNRDRQTIQIAGLGRVSVKLTRGSISARQGQRRRGCWYVDIEFDRYGSFALTELGNGCCY